MEGCNEKSMFLVSGLGIVGTIRRVSGKQRGLAWFADGCFCFLFCVRGLLLAMDKDGLLFPCSL